MQHLTTAIHTRLNAHAPLVALVADRIHLGSAPGGATLPHIVFTITRNQPRQSFATAHLGAEIGITVTTSRDAGAHAALAISDAVFDALHDQSLTVANHTAAGAACLDRGQLNDAGDTYVITAPYHVWATAR